ncbi:NAD(P)-binding protein [Serendipita vermifera]|nr:NAD(P)-binding protein [Serendipita vermifera]
MATSTKVFHIGASGNVGAPILNALIAAKKFEITVLARPTSSFTASDSSVKVVKLGFDDKAALVDALKGHDVVLISLGDLVTLEELTKTIVEAAIEAGVRRIIPSEFGTDLRHSPGREQTIFGSKHKLIAWFEQKAAEGVIEYSSIASGTFFEWGLTSQFSGFDIPNRKATIFNGGTAKVNMTLLDSIAQAVVSIISDPVTFKNRPLRIHDFFVSQNEILSILEEETGAKFTVEAVDLDGLVKKAEERLAQGEVTEENIYTIIKGHVLGEESSARWGEDDDSVVAGLTKRDLRAEIKKLL